MKSVIYATKGPAREYCEIALNLYKGCTHGCLYCYVPKITHQLRDGFHLDAIPRVSIDDIDISAAASEGDSRSVLLCFTSDPYQTTEEYRNLTRAAILSLHDYDHPVTILTKGGVLAQRDFGLYRPGDSFGVTLTFLDEEKSRLWEPGAALPGTRIKNLIAARKAGIPTWVSLEPVIDTQETISLIHTVAPYVDHFKVGKLNYDRLAGKIDWKNFADEVIDALKFTKKGFYIKKGLAKYIGHPEGIKEGTQLP
jgi:DNA repair photolyase